MDLVSVPDEVLDLEIPGWEVILEERKDTEHKHNAAALMAAGKQHEIA